MESPRRFLLVSRRRGGGCSSLERDLLNLSRGVDLTILSCCCTFVSDNNFTKMPPWKLDRCVSRYSIIIIINNNNNGRNGS